MKLKTKYCCVGSSHRIKYAIVVMMAVLLDVAYAQVVYLFRRPHLIEFTSDSGVSNNQTAVSVCFKEFDKFKNIILDNLFNNFLETK